MSRGLPPTSGALVEVDHAGDTTLALVRDGGRRGQLKVVTATAGSLTLSTAKMKTNLGLHLANPASDDEAQRRLQALAAAVDEALAGIDLDTIWQLVGSEGSDPLAADELAELWFDDRDAISVYAMLLALREDGVFFKRKGDQYAARSEKDVAAARHQRAAERRREEAVTAFAEAVGECLEAGDPACAERRLRDDHQQRPYLDLIADFAAFADAFERRDEAERLLRVLGQQLPAAQIRVSPLGAFGLLLALGLVDEHENLALRRYHIRTAFEPGLIELAEGLADGSLEQDGEGLVERPDRAAITIDDSSTRDMDDALDVQRLPDGACEIGIHITDVAAAIRPDSPLDREARRRGASVYLPTGVIPMLPSALSEGALSLVAGARRPVLSFRVRFDAQNQLTGWELEMAVITVRERLTYEQADEQLASGSGPWAEALTRLSAVARAREAARMAAGAFRIDLPDIQVKLAEGAPEVATVPRTPARALVSEMMILAGEIAASYCLRAGLPTVFRVQDSVVEDEDRRRVDAIADKLARELERTRLLRRGELRSEPARHVGLGLDAYVQATSPIRRYADLVVHYQIRAHLLGRRPVFDAQQMVTLAARAERAAADCQAAQRDTQRYWLLESLRRRDDPQVEAVALYVDPKGRRPTIPVLLPETMLRANLAARGLSAGDRLTVRVVQADPRRDLLKVARDL